MFILFWPKLHKSEKCQQQSEKSVLKGGNKIYISHICWDLWTLLVLMPKILLKMVQKPGDFLELWKVCAAAYFCQWTAMCFVAAAGGSNVKISSCHRYFPPPVAHSLDTAAHCTLNSGQWTQLPHSLDTHTHWLHTPTTTLQTLHTAQSHCALTEHTAMLRSPVQTALFTLCFQH